MPTYEDYTVAIVCAMDLEMNAVRYMLDEEHQRLPIRDGDRSLYILGKLHGHNTALACLPGNQGKGAAAVVATNMARTFPSIKWRLLVGIGGGVPSDKHDIRLGDVVVSMPEGSHGGVVQYDLGKDKEDVFELKGFLVPPPSLLRSAVVTMKSDHLVGENKILEYLAILLQRGSRLKQYARPDVDTDVLFDADCNSSKIIKRSDRGSEGPQIHYGLIASGDRVMRSATKRNLEVQKTGDILCFEMEAAGLMTEFECIVIRGISDYADSHKNDDWQHAAAAAAAACAKELLSYLDTQKASELDKANDRPRLLATKRNDDCRSAGNTVDRMPSP
ncbi:hypothetical protein PG984_002749 [Apiospora sp. TS-2023a]